jgi:PAS domain S-box-containing protein
MFNLSLKSQISAGIATLIMLSFFIVKTLVTFGILEYSNGIGWYEYLSVILFMPPFFIVVSEFIRNISLKESQINSQLEGINKSNLVVILTIDGYILSANPNFCDLMGYEEDQIVNQPHKKMVSLSYSKSKEYDDFWETLRNGKSITGEFERIDKNGNKKWLYGNYTPLKNSNNVYDRVLKIATDVTTNHEAENLVNQKNAYLEHAAKILRHDMHSGINTYMPRGLSSLKRRLTDDDIKNMKLEAPIKMLSEGLKHSQRVYAGVKEFTNLVKQDAVLDKQFHNLKDILDEYLSSTAYKNQVTIDELPSINVNQPLFCTAIDNLIRNGLKYNDSVTKHVYIFMENESTLVVKDNGRGLTREEFIELSQPYTRKKGQKEAGTGLGLNICISILEEHSFIIDCEKLEIGTKLSIKVL